MVTMAILLTLPVDSRAVQAFVRKFLWWSTFQVQDSKHTSMFPGGSDKHVAPSSDSQPMDDMGGNPAMLLTFLLSSLHGWPDCLSTDQDRALRFREPV